MNPGRGRSYSLPLLNKVVRDDQKITHEELVHILNRQFPEIVRQFSRNIIRKLNVEDVLREAGELYWFSSERYHLLRKFLEYRRGWFFGIAGDRILT